MNSQNQNPRALVFDVPTRVFHWVFAASFIIAFLIGKTTDDESAIFPIHAGFGMIMLIALFFRAVWGLVGTKYARFTSFKLNPADLFKYLGSVFSNKKEQNLGRNPASSFAAIAMFGLAIGLGVTGYNMGIGKGGHDLKEVHEVLATLFLLTAIAHVAGIIIHTIKQKDPIGLSMIDGRKAQIEGQVGISKSFPLVGLGLIAALGFSGFAIAKNYDATEKSYNLLGQKLTIGENEEEGENEGMKNGESHEDEAKESEGSNEKHEENEYKGATIGNMTSFGKEDIEKSEKGESKEHEAREHEKEEK